MTRANKQMRRTRLARRLGAAVAFLAIAAGPASCTFIDGQPWGEVDGRAAARPVADSGSAAIPDELTVDRAQLRVEMFLESVSTTAGGGGGSFDPANPPEGYTLCHTGHCHTEEGELVSYEDVQAEMAAGGGTSVTTLGQWKTTIDLTSGRVAELPAVAIDDRTSIDRLKVKATNLILEADWEGADAAVPLEAQLGQFEVGTLEGLAVDVGPDAPERQTIDLCVDWSNDWFERVDFGALEKQDGTIRLTRILNADATTDVVDAVKRARLEASSCGS